jgi:hypothetical protein
MDAFSYLSVLISIILALGMTRVLAGVGEMLQARSRRRLYWVHAVWVANLFLYLVVAWWIFYRWRNQQQWTFFLFIFVLISPTILYLASIVLFPPESSLNEFVNYKTHYYFNPTARFSSSLPCSSRFRGHPAERHPTFSCLRAAVLHQQQSLFRWASDRCGYAR